MCRVIDYYYVIVMVIIVHYEFLVFNILLLKCRLLLGIAQRLDTPVHQGRIE
jgi:hypothetical protein